MVSLARHTKRRARASALSRKTCPPRRPSVACGLCCTRNAGGTQMRSLRGLRRQSNPSRQAKARSEGLAAAGRAPGRPRAGGLRLRCRQRSNACSASAPTTCCAGRRRRRGTRARIDVLRWSYFRMLNCRWAIARSRSVKKRAPRVTSTIERRAAVGPPNAALRRSGRCGATSRPASARTRPGRRARRTPHDASHRASRRPC